MSKKKKIILIAAAAAVVVVAAVAVVCGVTLSGGGPYSGTILDTNGAPVAGVSVSDGRHVVKTDENGTFKLNGYRKTRFICISTPAGYVCDNYYLPVSDDISSYDFTLTPSERTAQDNYSFLQISDTEIGENGIGDWLEDIQATVQEHEPAFLVHTGDLCYEDGIRLHKEQMNSENMGLPVYYVMGNHDYVDGKYGEALYESYYGPVWYSFNVGNIHYVVTPFQTGGDYASDYSKNDRWRWLENDLENTDPNMKVVMLNHTMPPNEDYVLSFDLKKLDLNKHNLVAWIFGHYHYNYVYETNGVVNISTARPDCGGIDSSASGSRLIYMTRDGVEKTEMQYYHLSSAPSAPENAVWSTYLDGNVLFTDTLLEGDLVYTATVDDDYPHDCYVYCLNAENGEILWNFQTENSVKNNLAYTNGKLLAQDCDGNVYCLDGESGSLIWQAKAELSYTIGTSSGICTDGETVFAGNAADVSAFSVANGERLWTYNGKRGENSPAEFILTGDKLIVSSHWDALKALDKTTGKELWSNDDEDIRFRSSTPAVVNDTTLLVAVDDAIMLVNSETGEITSKKMCEDYSFSSSGQPVIDETRAYIPTANHGIVTFDIEQEKILWEMQPGEAQVYTPPYVSNSPTVESTPVLTNGQLVFGASDGKLYRISASGGSVISSYDIGAPVFGKAALCEDGSVIVADFAGRISKIAP